MLRVQRCAAGLGPIPQHLAELATPAIHPNMPRGDFRRNISPDEARTPPRAHTSKMPVQPLDDALQRQRNTHRIETPSNCEESWRYVGEVDSGRATSFRMLRPTIGSCAARGRSLVRSHRLNLPRVRRLGGRQLGNLTRGTDVKWRRAVSLCCGRKSNSDRGDGKRPYRSEYHRRINTFR